LLLLSQEYDF
ncbi:hypothetical protein BAE44_0025597, partial [Dichanthelium oligosanthes]